MAILLRRDRPQLNLSTMHGTQHHYGMWRMCIRRRELKLKTPKNHAQCHLGLKQCKILTDTDPWPPSEREKCSRFLGRLGDPLSEPIGPELVDVVSPDVLVVVDVQHGHLENHTRWVPDASDLNLLVCLPGERTSRWVQPENFIKNHCHGFESIKTLVVKLMFSK